MVGTLGTPSGHHHHTKGKPCLSHNAVSSGGTSKPDQRPLPCSLWGGRGAHAGSESRSLTRSAGPEEGARHFLIPNILTHFQELVTAPVKPRADRTMLLTWLDSGKLRLICQAKLMRKERPKQDSNL